MIFTVIDKVYPPITNGYYNSSSSISWPVATLVVFFPIFILLMWLLEKEYRVEPERQNSGIHKWLTYLTLFISGLTIAVDLIYILYKFIDGQDLTTGFVLKVFALLVVVSSIFIYYISDLRGKLTPSYRMFWRGFAVFIVLGSVIWGFVVLGSPATQRKYKYDDTKVNDLMNINSAVQSYYSNKGVLPKSFTDLSTQNYYIIQVDSQTQKNYEYIMTSNTSYQLCAEFNMASDDNTKNPQMYPYGGAGWTHPAGRYCFVQTISPAMYPGGKLTL